jgi:hypothetical protein
VKACTRAFHVNIIIKKIVRPIIPSAIELHIIPMMIHGTNLKEMTKGLSFFSSGQNKLWWLESILNGMEQCLL